jgi:hypothetical protein
MCVAGVQVALADADLYTMKQIVQGVDDLDPDEFNNPSDSGTQTDTFNLKCSCQPFQCKNPFAFNTPRKTTSEFVSRLQRCFTAVQKAFVKVVLCLNTFFDSLSAISRHTHAYQLGLFSQHWHQEAVAVRHVWLQKETARTALERCLAGTLFV